jgi:hypothetical protein
MLWARFSGRACLQVTAGASARNVFTVFINAGIVKDAIRIVVNEREVLTLGSKQDLLRVAGTGSSVAGAGGF